MPSYRRYQLLQRALSSSRRSAALTQAEVARRIGRPQSYVSKYESGERVLDVIEFLDVCIALDVDPQNILCKLERQ